MNVDKTRTYIQRSKSSPLELSLKNREGASYLDEAALLVVPHIRRLKSLTVHANVLPSVLRNCCCHAPPLEKLGVCVAGPKNPVLDSAPPNGDLSSLGTLCVRGVITHLPWRNLRNLRVFTLASRPPGRSVTQLLDILESAPLLHTVDLEDSVPDSSDAPPERIVPLCYLKTFTLSADPPHPILLNHLSIPVGASMISWIVFSGEESPLPDYPPEGSPNLRNLSCITSINLSFRVIRKFMRLSGPSGSLPLFAYWEGEGETDLSLYIVDHRVLCSLSPPILSGTQRLSVSKYRHSHPTKVEDCPVFRALSFANNLRRLILIKCHTLPFILTLNPEENSSKLMLCPNVSFTTSRRITSSTNTLSIWPRIELQEGRSSHRSQSSAWAALFQGERC